jgi:Secretion system C-terminal sorting domain
VISAGSVGTSGVNLSVVATYPGGASSTAASYTVVTGILPAPTQIIPNSENLPPSSQADFDSPGANLWSVSPGSSIIQRSNNGDDILVQVTSATSGDVIVTAYATDACGTSPGFSRTYPIQSNSGTPLSYHSALPDSASALGIAPLLPSTSPVLYPNPAGGSVQVFIPATDFTRTYIKLYDIKGHLIQMIIPSAQNTTLDISRRAKGIYIVEIFDGKQLMTKKLVTQ